MKKLLSIVLSMTTLLTNSFGTSYRASADIPTESTFTRAVESGVSVKVTLPRFTSGAHWDFSKPGFFSSQGKIELLNKELLPDGAFVAVRLRNPQKYRLAKNAFKKMQLNPGENRMSIFVYANKSAWFDVVSKIKKCVKTNKAGVYIPYALVPTSFPQEKKLSLKPVEEGEKKKEFVDAEKFRKLVEEKNGKPLLNEFAESYMRNAIGVLKNPKAGPDPLGILEQGGLNSLNIPDYAFDSQKYYSFVEAKEENQKREKLRKGAEGELIESVGITAEDLMNSETEGVIIAKLTKEEPVQTFRLVVNNSIGEGGQADLLALLLSNQAKVGQTIKDDSSLTFDYTMESDLPNRLSNPRTEEEKAVVQQAQKIIEKTRVKPTLFKTLGNVVDSLTPNCVKNLLASILKVTSFGYYKTPRGQQYVKELQPDSRDVPKPSAKNEVNLNLSSIISPIAQLFGVESHVVMRILLLALVAYLGLPKLEKMFKSGTSWSFVFNSLPYVLLAQLLLPQEVGPIGALKTFGSFIYSQFQTE